MNSEMVYCNEIPKIAQTFNYKLWVILISKAPYCCGERESVIIRNSTYSMYKEREGLKILMSRSVWWLCATTHGKLLLCLEFGPTNK